MNPVDHRFGRKSKLRLNAKRKKRRCNNPSGLSKKKQLDVTTEENSQSILEPQAEVETFTNNQEKCETEVHPLEQDMEVNPRMAYQEKPEADEIFEMSNDVHVEQLSVNEEDNSEHEDLKPSLKELQEHTPSTVEHFAVCDVDTICRLCGAKLDEEECIHTDNNVFCHGYPEKILTCTSLKVIQGDGLPPNMCAECMANLNSAYDFRNVCIATCSLFLQSKLNNSLMNNSPDSYLHSTKKTTDNGDTYKNIEPQTEEKNHNSLRCCDGINETRIHNDSSFGDPDNDQHDLEDVVEKMEPEEPLSEISHTINTQEIIDMVENNTVNNLNEGRRETRKSIVPETEENIDDFLQSCDDINQTVIHDDTGFSDSDHHEDDSEAIVEEVENEEPVFKAIESISTQEVSDMARNNTGQNIESHIEDDNSYLNSDIEMESEATTPPVYVGPLEHTIDGERVVRQTCDHCCGSGIEPIEEMDTEEPIFDSGCPAEIQNRNDTEDDEDSFKKVQTETDEELGVDSAYCDDINREDEDDNRAWPWSQEDDKNEGTEKTIFNKTYPSTTKMYTAMAERDIAKYFKRGGTVVLCPFCPDMFLVEDNSEILLHLDSHAPTKQMFMCRYPHCNKRFTSHVYRNDHQAAEHGKRLMRLPKSLCCHCGIMATTARLKIHMLAIQSQTELYYECDLCSNQYKHKISLREHILGVHNSKRYQCKECKEMIPRHKRGHHWIKQHASKVTCSYCNKEFLQRNIKGHLRTHTGEKPFSCTDCGMEFTFRVSLKTHRKRYHNDNMFEDTVEM